MNLKIRSLTFLLLIGMSLLSCSEKAKSPSLPTTPGTGNNGNSDNDNSNDNTDDDDEVEKIALYQADPAIFEEDGTFYLYGTNDENPNTGFQVYSSKDLKTWISPLGSRDGYALTNLDNFGTRGFWAPQVWKDNGTYYMAYVADEHIAISTSNKATGLFSQNNRQQLFSGSKKQIDPFVYKDDDGKKYMFFVDITNGNKIFMTEMADDFMSVKDATGTECIRSTEGWEDNGQPSAKVTEGPTVIKHNGYYYLIYSANHFENPNYAVGYATSKQINGPWKKYEGNPILSRNLVQWSGTGHGDLIFRKDGSVYRDTDGYMYYVFHTHNSSGGARKTPRRTAIIKMKFKNATDDGPDTIEIDPDSFEHILVNK